MASIPRKLKTLRHHPRAAFLKYANRVYFKLISAPRPYIDEDYNKHWGFTDFNGKNVLDLGADYGSTAYFFLKKGAKSVVAVEGDHHRAQKLAENGVKYGFKSIELMIKSPRDVEQLLESDKFDQAKVDVEGAESNLVQCKDGLLKSVPFWMIESHSEKLTSSIIKRFEELGFRVKQVQVHDPGKPVLLVAKLD